MQLLKGTLGMVVLTVGGTIIVLLMTNGVRLINKLFARASKTQDKFGKEGM